MRDDERAPGDEPWTRFTRALHRRIGLQPMRHFTPEEANAALERGAAARRADGRAPARARRGARAAGGARGPHSRQRRRHPAGRARRGRGRGRARTRASSRSAIDEIVELRRRGEGHRRGARRLPRAAPRRDGAALLEARRGRDRLLAHASRTASPAGGRCRSTEDPGRRRRRRRPYALLAPHRHRRRGLRRGHRCVARVVDWWLARRPLPPEAATRYRVLRRSDQRRRSSSSGFFSALLVIPQVRAVAGGLLASSAVLGVIIGFAVAADARELRRRAPDRDHPADAARRPRRPTTARTASSRRSASRTRSSAPSDRRGSSSRTRSSPPIPSATRRSAAGRRSQRSPCRFRSQPISTPRSTRFAKRSPTERDARCTSSSLDGNATVTVRAAAADEDAAQRLERDLRVRAHGRLRALGVWG